MRIRAEVTPRAADGVLAFGELLAASIVAAVFRDRGLPACRVDAREVMRTDEAYGAAEVDLATLRERCRERVGPRVADGELPVLEGFIGATGSGQTTTLGRGGSDTSAALLGLALDAEEIQIWTDVDGLMSADPRIVPGARTLERVSFREAAELAAHGARVLHPAAVAPAVRRQIPVRVLNSLRPGGAGTLIVGDADPANAGAPMAVASREDICLIRVLGRALREDATMLPGLLERCRRQGIVPALVVASGLQVTLVAGRGTDRWAIEELAGPGASIEQREACGLVCVVGAGLARSASLRLRVLGELARFDPEVVATGAAETSVVAVLDRAVLVQAVRELHRTFFEGALAS
jgi:aspartate kinase